MLWGHVSEDDAGGDLGTSPEQSSLAEVGFTKIWKAEQPEDGFGEAREDTEPGAEGSGFDLDDVVSVEGQERHR